MFNTITTFITGITMAFAGIFNPAPLELPPVEPAYGDLGAFAPAAGGTYRLKSSIGTTNTTITLSSFKEPVSNANLTMDYLGTDIAYGTIDPQSSTRKEFISFTGITQNSDGSAQLTGVTRGLGFTSPFTASSTLRKSHPGQSIFILSDSPQFFNEYARRRSDETITGSWTVPTPTSASNPATKAYVDSVVTGGAVTLDGIAMAATAGETFATGTVVYFDDGADEWLKASAATVASSTNVQLGIAQGAGTDGTAINGGVLTRGYDETQGGMTAGNTIYLSDTAGATSTSAGTNSVIIGQARSATQLYFDPIYGNTINSGSDTTFSGENTFSATTTLASTTVNGLATFNGGITGHASTTFTVYTASTTWSKPDGLEYIEVWACGGGGGGEAGEDSSNTGGTGGGGGGCAFELLTASELAATTSVTVTIGGAGTAGSGAGGDGGSGGSTLFSSFLSATGGGGGTSNANVSPGTGSGGDLNLSGQGSFKSDATGTGTLGGSSFFGGGGYGANTSAAAGGAGGTCGGGGGGGQESSNANGGAGGVGCVTIKVHF